MNQERMRCILFQWSEWPMGVGLSSKHWALRSHSFSAEQARRAGESAPPPASRRRFPRAQIPRNNKYQPEAKLDPAHAPEEEKVWDLSSLAFHFISPIFFISLQLLRDFYDWVVFAERSASKCAAVLRVPSLPHPSRAPPWIYFVLSWDEYTRDPCWTSVKPTEKRE